MENEFRIRSGELSETETTGWEPERRYYQRHIEMQIGAALAVIEMLTERLEDMNEETENAMFDTKIGV